MNSGPWRIMKQVNLVNFVIRKTPTSKDLTTHIDKIQHYYGKIPELWQKFDDKLAKTGNNEQQVTENNKMTMSRGTSPTPPPKIHHHR